MKAVWLVGDSADQLAVSRAVHWAVSKASLMADSRVEWKVVRRAAQLVVRWAEYLASR